MMRLKLCLISLVCCTAMALPVTARGTGKNDQPADQQQTITDQRKCFTCKTTGKLENPFYERYRDELEQVKYSSWAIETDQKGLGLPWIPCERCRNEELRDRAIEEFNGLAEKARHWLQLRREIDKTLEVEEPLLHLETEHYQWAWSIPKLEYRKRNYRSHEALFLYGRRMEEFYDEYQRIHRISDKDNLHNMHQIFCFEREIVAKRACPTYGQQDAPHGSVFLLGKPSVYVLWWDLYQMPTEEYLHRALVHHVAHMLSAVYKKPNWLYESGFAFEGEGHWWEQYYYQKASCRCSREMGTNSSWISNSWESRVKKAVLDNDQPSLASVIRKNGGSLTGEEHIFSWSYVDYMMHMDPRKTLDFYVMLKQKMPARDAFFQTWGWSVLGFEQQWKKYVLKNYKLKKKPVTPTKRQRARRVPMPVADDNT